MLWLAHRWLIQTRTRLREWRRKQLDDTHYAPNLALELLCCARLASCFQAGELGAEGAHETSSDCSRGIVCAELLKRVAFDIVGLPRGAFWRTTFPYMSWRAFAAQLTTFLQKQPQQLSAREIECARLLFDELVGIDAFGEFESPTGD